ncbi:MAG TPA: response regulator [Anaerolineaceae bacterium]|nr:response regulator [Anaerolineaceae bacterium]
MLNRIDFENWVKHVAANLYDYAALEAHPLTSVIFPSPGNRGETIRHLFVEAIEKLKPVGKEFNANFPEWRPYIILHQRYIKGIPLTELSLILSVGDRQLRRDHHRALQALTAYLWAALQPESDGEEQDNSAFTFEIHRERIDALEVLQGVQKILYSRAEEQNRPLLLTYDPPLPAILADRVILRQILISLFNTAFNQSSPAPIEATIRTNGPEVEICLSYWLPSQPKLDILDTVGYWAEQINARCEQKSRAFEASWQAEIILALPRADQRVIMVVDDQEPTINLFQRYLSKTDYVVVGVTNGKQAAETADRLQPALITLDVMMPQIDGWEVLQELKLNPTTRQIPVLICSAWQEPELARSLGAAGFLKKPITQRIFLQEIQHLGLLETI